MQKHYLAIDLGAESGRVMLGTLSSAGSLSGAAGSLSSSAVTGAGSLSGAAGNFSGGKLEVEEIHRFPNVPVTIQGTLRWDLLNLFSEIKVGLRIAAARGLTVSGISTDAWGVDYVLFSEREPMVTHPYHYRDPRTDGAMEKVFSKVSADEIFNETGIQFMPINTLFQLCTDAEKRPDVLDWADRFLNIGDYFNYLLTGKPMGEASLASTTQLFNPRKGDWSWDLIARLGLPKKIFPALVKPGTKLGPLLTEVALETNHKDVEVIAGCSHDTAAAVAAIPATSSESGTSGDWAFISSGTWSLLGTEARVPVIDAGSRKHNFTNEVGYGGTVMVRKNIVGLWIVQECRRAWSELGNAYDYDQLTAMAEAAEPLRSLIRPDDARFGKPGRMPGKIAEYCRETGQPVPTDPGSFIRCALESLALLYAKTLAECEAVVGRRFKTLHIVGGGSRNRLLNQFTAEALGFPVQAGPVEATAIGNLLIQARTLGDLSGPEDIRNVVRASFPVKIFAPENPGVWNTALKLFDTLNVST